MNQLNNKAAKNVLDTQPESASENEESDTITDHSSSMSERHKYEHATTSRTTAHKGGRSGNATMPAATQFSIVHRSDADGLRMRISAIRPPTAAQANTATSSSSNSSNKLQTTNKESNSKRKSSGGDKVYNHNENAKSQHTKHKYQQQQQQQGEESARPISSSTTTATMSMDGASSMDSAIHPNATFSVNAIGGGGLPLSLIPQAPCLSDATESGLSEATTTTIAATAGGGGNEKAAKKIKVKRKKAQTKANNEAKRALKKSRIQAFAASAANAFSSDSEDDVPLKQHSKHHHHQQQQQQQQPQQQHPRAPRLRLTAIINSKNNAATTTTTTAATTTTAPQLKSLTSLAETTHAATHGGGGVGSDNIGLSSSDNELPDLVSAAIKRVESDTDDTMMGGGGSVGGGAGFRKTAAKSKHLPQYQSTLLQDFMEKTQMLGETPRATASNSTSTSFAAATPPPPPPPTPTTPKMPLSLSTTNLDSNSQTDSIAASSRGGGVVANVTVAAAVAVAGVTKKRRGRPKKIVAPIETATTTTSSTSASVANAAATINESADSGVISTTSTAQSTSPPPVPKISTATVAAVAAAASPQSRLRSGGGGGESAAPTPKNPNPFYPATATYATVSASAATTTTLLCTKPKIDMAYLDKRMYATERVLYPPPRNKRRQSLSAASASVASQKTAAEKKFPTTSAVVAAKLTKEELQLDPVWRQIDVNKKFRRPSVSGYKSDGGGGNTTICSKILAAKSGYVSDYGSAVAARHSRSNNNASCSNQAAAAASSSHNHNSGYKSDASGKSRYSTHSCASRRSRAKSCGYRSDYKELNSSRTGGGDDVASTKSSKFRRKRRCSTFATTLRASAAHSKSVGNLNDEQDILQLAGLSLGQSSEESTEYVCKPSLESLPTTSVSKKYGEINRFIATGEYFGRGKNSDGGATFGSLNPNRATAAAAASACGDANGSQDGFRFSGKLLLQRKNSIAASEVTATQEIALPARKIKSRRSSAASYCSSYYSGTSRVRRRRRRKSFRFPSGGSLSNGKSGSIIDSKLLTEIEIITSTFATLCRIHATAKEKILTEAGTGGGKLQSLIASAAATAANKTARSDKRALKKRKMSENLDFALRSAAAAAAAASSSGGTAVSTGGGGGSSSGSTKRRHKKVSASSSPDDHKLPLKKRHYLLTPGEKSTEAAVAVAAKLFASNAEAWAAAAAAAKTTATTKAQLQFAAASAAAKAAAVAAAAAASKSNAATTSSTKSVGGGGLTPKKRHLLQQAEAPPHPQPSSLLTSTETIAPPSAAVTAALSSMKSSNSSPLRIVCDAANLGTNSAASTTSISGGGGSKLLDISPLSTTSGGGGSNATPRSNSAVTTPNEVTHKKRTRLEGLVTKIAITHGDDSASQSSPTTKEVTVSKTKTTTASSKSKETAPLKTKGLSTPRLPTPTLTPPTPQLDSEASCPPPGVFEPSIELEIQIPPIAKLSEAAAAIITKSEVDSPLLIELNKTYAAVDGTTKVEGTRVVESLLNKTGANLLLKRKRKKINRTGFPTVRRKKRKINEHLLLDVTPDISEQVQRVTGAAAVAGAVKARLTAAATPLTASDKLCDRVPQTGEASSNFLERATNVPAVTVIAATIRKPRVSVVALERLQGTPTKSVTKAAPAAPTRERGRPSKKQKLSEEAAKMLLKAATAPMEKKTVPTAAEKKQTDLPTSTVKRLGAAKPTKLLRTEPATEQLATSAQFIRAGVGARAATRKAKKTAAAAATVIAEAKSSVIETETASASAKQNKKSMAAAKTESVTANVVSSTPASFTKSTVHKIITAKSLESKVKLPAGIDPNTNFSCKIRLKRRSSIAPPPPVFRKEVAVAMTVAEETDIAAEAAAKLRSQTCPTLEDDVLPPSTHATNGCAAAEYCSSSGDERAAAAAALNNSTTTSTRKLPRLKKNYLPAGLFSDYFKLTVPTMLAPQSSGVISKNEKSLLPPPPPPPPKPTATSTSTKNINADKKELAIAEASTTPTTPPPLLMPPPYCEKYFRRTEIDFQLPYDIWWAAKNAKLPSRITVPSWNYRKIRTNIYADAVRPNLNGIDHPTCNCKPDAGCGDNCLNRMVYTECWPSSCPTRERCRNQKIQRHEIAPGAERFMTTDKGWGVRTRLPIPKGTYIMEYVGEVVTEREFKDRMGTIYLNDTHHYCLHLDGGLVIDGHRMGSDGRFVNHSCQPNCEMQKWSVNGLSRMALFAKRPINEGEELTYDYNFSLFNPAEGQPCRCNTPQCRGVIGGKSQRVKPLPPAEAKQPTDSSALKTTAHNGRQRKHKARKNATTTQRLQAKDVIVTARVQQLSEREKKLVKLHDIFLVRNFEKIRRCKAKRNAAAAAAAISPESKASNSATISSGNNAPAPPLHHNNGAPHTNTTAASTAAGAITNRRPSTPSSLAAQISALCSPRNMKTRGLTHAVQDPEVEKMAKMAVILRDICATLETLKDTSAGGSSGDKVKLSALAFASSATTSSTNVVVTSKKKKALKAALLPPPSSSSSSSQKPEAPLDLRTVQANIEQGYYKQPSEFDADMQKIFEQARRQHQQTSRSDTDEAPRLRALNTLVAAYEAQKQKHYAQLQDLLLCEVSALANWRSKQQVEQALVNKSKEDADATKTSDVVDGPPKATTDATKTPSSSPATPTTPVTSDSPVTPTEDIIRCICGLYKDEGLMIQCARCMCWQHAECTKADVTSDTDYHCERCEPREVEREIPLEDYTDDGHRYYLALMRGAKLHVRQGDAVYVLRDIPITDADGRRVSPAKKHTYETIGDIDYNECDIFRVERLWRNAATGQRYIFGHHFLRPHETFHEPSRRFYPNEVVRVPLYEVVPIELVIGRCWVLDRTTFCKGRPIECRDAEEHCYICELRVDKSARFFSKAKINYPTCTKSYAFRKFDEKLKICKSYAPHDVDPSMLKTKKPKSEIEAASSTGATAATVSSNASTPTIPARQDLYKTPQNAATRKRQSSSPATASSNAVHLFSPVPPTMQTIKGRRTRLENVLKAMKLKWKKNTQTAASGGGGGGGQLATTEPPIDLSYLLSGRGARQRKTANAAAAAAASASGT